MFDSSATAVISTCEFDNKALKAFKLNENGFIEGISNNKYPFMRRQDLPKIYLSNGAIYIIKVDVFMMGNSFFTDKTKGCIMSEEDSIDIDTTKDIEIAKIKIRAGRLSNH